jgi:hypothetical protein
MAYKIKKSIIQGTKAHKSAIKAKVEEMAMASGIGADPTLVRLGEAYGKSFIPKEIDFTIDPYIPSERKEKEEDNGEGDVVVVKGCMDKKAKNYNPDATESDDSCEYEKEDDVGTETTTTDTDDDYDYDASLDKFADDDANAANEKLIKKKNTQKKKKVITEEKKEKTIGQVYEPGTQEVTWVGEGKPPSTVDSTKKTKTKKKSKTTKKSTADRAANKKNLKYKLLGPAGQKKMRDAGYTPPKKKKKKKKKKESNTKK